MQRRELAQRLFEHRNVILDGSALRFRVRLGIGDALVHHGFDGCRSASSACCQFSSWSAQVTFLLAMLCLTF